jgi:hypothetical protein
MGLRLALFGIPRAATATRHLNLNPLNREEGDLFHCWVNATGAASRALAVSWRRAARIRRTPLVVRSHNLRAG